MLNRKPARDRFGPAGVTDRPVVPVKPGNSGGGKGPEFKVKEQRARIRRLTMSLTTPEKIRRLQRAFYAKAKEQPSYRFHQL
jgi:RNA-directed DNA polymerase